MSLVVVIILNKFCDIHQKKFYACDLHLIREDHWAGRPTTGAQRGAEWRKLRRPTKSSPTQLSQRELRWTGQKSAIESRSGKNYLFTNFVKIIRKKTVTLFRFVKKTSMKINSLKKNHENTNPWTKKTNNWKEHHGCSSWFYFFYAVEPFNTHESSDSG